MILKRLTEFADRAGDELGAKKQPPPMYLYSPVRYILDLTLEGNPKGGLIDTADKINKSGIRRFNPHIGRTVAIVPKLFTDTGEYVLGIPRVKSEPDRVADCNAAFKSLVREAAKMISLTEVQAIRNFLEAWNPDRPSFKLPDNYDPGAVIAFQVNGVFPTDLPEVQQWWERYTADQLGLRASKAEEDGTESVADQGAALDCLVCGKHKPVLRRLPSKLKGIPGGQVAGTALISANAEAFLSYGLEASLIAPTCRDCAEKFTYAINTLIGTESSHLRVGNLIYIFWTREPTKFDFFNLLNSPTPEMVGELLKAAFKGRKQESEDEFDNAFYATAFSASGGRAVLRDWIETTVPAVRLNLARYFALQRIMGFQGQLEVFPLRRLGNATVPLRKGRPDEDKLAPQIPQVLMRAALHGDLMPFSLLQAATNRCKAEQGVNAVRAALIKMVILSQKVIKSEKEDFMMQLELDIREPAYLCGRLLAVVEATQRAALPGIKATLTDRYYGAASSAPASVFGPLLRGAQAHLSKLRKTRMPAYLALDARLQDILAGLQNNFPKTLSLTDQGLFALGYYHQKAKDRADAQARKLGLIEDEESATNKETEN